ncbi:hypothetical protein HL033_00775 [Neoehrlichia mikurensis]|uniref:NlpC/P60 domain-containing protein n=1 Tax=Neoehrlichia mikurensis TaxID=89586 RepID=A0A9Q9BXE6_9RICK|nr:NlpC/P60 family protein [Neoehrlichia mikurensis]QXK92103.1 hypothetical protein IAH97_00775 [Neoehrlichia mikurensis]QXK92560.1 hypothetical protein HUN61_00775 [Neoehrlichia mikurensis]QXK93796.1 hypothetical protein HL033_00775 [Neoehrlichia mikurensis]UTO55228.1 hypothetical protein LUA82_03475 [Neoehrlichia mikurensis]UTO56148.1 hypothetical protein LUA81_03440 [Neoehrlichia mikurensis]
MYTITRKRIIDTARKWIGTQFHYQGRLKKNAKCHGGCDCIGLIIGIARDLNIQSKNHLPLHYSDQVNYNIIDKDAIYHKIQHLLIQKEISHALPGDILLIRIHRVTHHFAILSYNYNIIHTSATIKQVTEHKLFPKWYNMITYTFSFPFIHENKTYYPKLLNIRH